MRKRYLVSMLVAVAIVVANAGCNAITNSNIAEIQATLNKQQGEIADLRKTLESKNVASSEQDQLFNAAVILVKKSPPNQAHTAISLFGAICGLKAEPVLLEMLETASPNQLVAIVEALNNMRSPKCHDVFIKILTNEENQQITSNLVNMLQNNPNLIKKSDLPEIEKVLEKFPNNDYNNNRYVRGVLVHVILRLDQKKGIQYVCNDLVADTSNQKQNIIYQITNYNFRLSLNSWKKIIESAGGCDGFNLEVYSAILRGLSQTGDIRATDLILPWAEFAKNNNNFRHQFADALLRLKDPQAASTLLNLCQTEPINNYGRINLDNYPGIKKENNIYSLIDAAAMAKLLEQRSKKVESLNELEKKYVEKENEINLTPSKPVFMSAGKSG